jgi:hypothetical protein
VRATIDRSSPSYVFPEDRIAVFDQDGTLWVEHPMYSQIMYCLDWVPVLATQKPALKNAEPFKTVLSGNRDAIARLSAGPSILLEPPAAQAIVVVLHELTTNVAKYGALSARGGHVQVEWSRDRDGPVVLRWIEIHGPPVEPPKKQGFGSRVVENMIKEPAYRCPTPRLAARSIGFRNCPGVEVGV